MQVGVPFYVTDSAATISLVNSIAHLVYLYWNLPNGGPINPCIWLFDHNVRPVTTDHHLYFGNLEGTDSLVELFKQQQCDRIDVPGYDACFLHPNYINAVEEGANRNGMSWLSWLELVAGVQRTPQLFAKGSSCLSGEFQYIIKHRSERLLWILKRFWPKYERGMQSVGSILQDSQLKVEGNALSLPLHQTFLPLPQLRDLVRRYRVPSFDFVTMTPQPCDDGSEWRFRECLQVKFTDDIQFYLQAISKIQSRSSGTAIYDRETEDAIFRVYENIQRRCNENLGLVRYTFLLHAC